MQLPFGKKNIENAGQALQQAAAQSSSLFETPVSEFIPYYCHYNPTTILTKNGELMQVVKIATNAQGLNYESGQDRESVVREVIRDAIREHVGSESYSMWLHTIRKRQSIRYRGKYKEEIAAKVQDRWQQVHHWKYQYYNEIYLTVLHEGQGASIAETKNLKDLILPSKNRSLRNRYLEQAEKDLVATVQNLMGHIAKSFVPQLLSVVERVPDPGDLPTGQPLFYSEPMEFLGNILNLRVEPVLLPQLDISEALATTRHTFGFNALETKSPSGKRRFASVLSLKQYREVPPDTMDKLLQAPMEFVVTQAFNYIPHQGALRQYREQKELFEISGDLYCIEASGIADMMASQSDKKTDFGEHQTTLMVLSDEFKQLDSEIAKVQAAFSELGLITIREDIKLEECFWSQLPANFEFIRRKDTINTSRIAGFCRLNRYPQGLDVGNHWGEAVTIMTTRVGSPYFFNFHHQDNGHSLFLDFNSFNDQSSPILMNFLLSQSRKYNGKLFLFDKNRSADLLFEKLGGAYHTMPTARLETEFTPMKLNPFSLPDHPRNRGFLMAWLGILLGQDIQLPEAQKEVIREGIEYVYREPEDKRCLQALVNWLEERDVPLSKAFARWSSGGEFGSLFDRVLETVDMSADINGFDLDPAYRKPDCLLPVFSYLLHRILTGVDGRPTMVVLHSAFSLINNPFVGPRLESLLQMLQDNNTAVIFCDSDPMRAMQTPVFETVLNQCATLMVMPDDVVHDYSQMPLRLSLYDAKMLLKIDRQKGEFMLRQGGESILLKTNLKELDELYAVFANDRKNLAAALGSGQSKTLAG